MKYFKYLALLAVLAFAAGAPSQAQVRLGVGIGVGPVYGGYAAPACAYGYYGYAPYSCAPYGYYGPDWFSGGLFIGAGPWFHGFYGFYGHVDNRYDPHHGYRGPMPERGAQPFNHFQANEARDGQGHSGNAGHNGA